MLTQKDAVFKAITAKRAPDGSFDRNEVVVELMAMFRAGEFTHGSPEQMSDDKELRKYCSSIISNWLRKDDRIGGSPTAETRGERRKAARAADTELVRLTKAKVLLRANNQSTAEIDQLIEQRSATLQQEQLNVKHDVEQAALNVLDATAILSTIENQ